MALAITFEFDDIPFVAAGITIDGKQILARHLMIDTGCAKTVFNVDLLLDIGITMDGEDVLVDMYGIGGRETVLERTVDALKIREFSVDSFVIQRGPLNYGFVLDGIIGSDFLRRLGLVIDYGHAELRQDS